MHAIIETGGKQYRVAPGDVIRVEKLAGDVGSEVELPVKASFKEGGELASGGKVTGTIVGNDRAAKILVFKFKRPTHRTPQIHFILIHQFINPCERCSSIT